MKELTVNFITAAGFQFIDTTEEDEFSYKHYAYLGLYVELFVFINYFRDGKVTYQVDMDNMELKNVGEDELLTLLKILPKTDK